MTGLAMGFSSKTNTLPARRGERVAKWVEDYMRVQGCSVSEVAFRIRQDKRDVQRLLAMKSCGHALEDALAAYFGWTFVKCIMAPVVESSIEAEIAREEAEIAAREERLAQLYRAREGAGVAPRLADAQDRIAAPPNGRGA